MRPWLRNLALYVLSMGLMYALCHQPPCQPELKNMPHDPWPQVRDA